MEARLPGLETLVVSWRKIAVSLIDANCHEVIAPLSLLRASKDKKNAGLKAVTLIATLNPVSQVLW